MHKNIYEGFKQNLYNNNSWSTVKKYHPKHMAGTSVLCYRDLPFLIRKYAMGTKALDFGCGTGFSTNLVTELNFDTIGVDISERMLSEGRIFNPGLDLRQIEINSLPFENKCFDLVLSTFVLFDIPNMALLIEYLKEARRVLKPDGVLIACTGSEHLHVNNWLTIEHDVEKNSQVKPGEMYESYSKELDTTFFDVFYTHQNYVTAFTESGLVIEELHQSLGKISDDINWHTEWKLPPYSTYVCRPIKLSQE